MSKWQVIILKPAENYLSSLSESERERLLKALKQLQDDPLACNYKKLTGRS
jgi:mRNA-degrading endonuclease RelE of RelBE toxin-antitoxin system